MRHTARLAFACALTLALSLLATPLAHADTRDTTPDRSRTFKAYERDAGTLFRIRFSTSLPNTKRRVQAKLDVSMPSSAADELLVGTYSMYCAPAGTNRGDNKILGSQNILRGRAVSFNPHYLYTAATPGQHECWLRLSSGRPRPTKYKVSSNVLKVGYGSYLQLSNPQHRASQQGFTPREPSKLVKWHKTVHTAAATITVPLLANRLNVSGDLWLTTCSSRGGSQDPVTGKHLCEGYINRAGSTIRSTVVVSQRRLFGDGFCAVSYFPSASGRTTYISKDVHHMMRFEAGHASISSNLGCSRTVTVQVRVQHLSGAAVVIHNQGTITTGIMPTE